MHNYKELKVWQKAVQLATDVYYHTQDFPKEERFGLTLQIRKSAVSISSNIGEGAGRLNKNEFIQFLGVAHGSASELDTQLIVANNFQFLNDDIFEELSGTINEIKKMIFKLIESLDK